MSFDPNKPVQTREGKKARIICTDAKNDFPIIALVEDGCYETQEGFTLDGYFHRDKCYQPSQRDLVNIPETCKVKVWFYRQLPHGPICAKASCEVSDVYEYIAVREIEITEGERPTAILAAIKKKEREGEAYKR